MKQSKTKFGECSHLSTTQKKRTLETLGKERLTDIDRVLNSFMYIVPLIFILFLLTLFKIYSAPTDL